MTPRDYQITEEEMTFSLVGVPVLLSQQLIYLLQFQVRGTKHIAETRRPGSRNLRGVGMLFKEYCCSLWEREPERTWSTCKNLEEEYEHGMFIRSDCNQQLAV